MRPPSNPWHADHAIFAVYRWLTWGVTALWLLGQGRLSAYSAALAVTLLLTLVLTALARPYIRIARHTPGVMGLDILLVVAAIIGSGGWESPFFFYALGSLVLPALLFGWLGGVMAGLTFVAINLSALVAVGMPPADRLFEGTLGSLSVLLTMVVPPTFGGLFAVMLDHLRHQSAHGGSGHGGSPRPQDDATYSRDTRSEPPQIARMMREGRRSGLASGDAPVVVPLTRTRTVEPSVEELRRVIFAPMPAPEMDLGAVFDVLATRFNQQTGIATRLSMIGRTRLVRPIHRDLLVRLVQEALLNIQQHAHATAVTLTLRYDINSVQLLVQDDGVGLAEGTHERPGLRALRAMHYRVGEFGGRLDVFETEGGGVTVRATMPLE